MPSPDPALPSARRGAALLPLRVVYNAYGWSLFLLLALGAVAGVLVVPSLTGRRSVVRFVARSFLRLAGMPLELQGAERLPAGQCVIVANHASYLDGLVFKAALPPRFSFVIKREMNAVPLAGLMLRRIGSQFVDRFNRHRGASDARRVLRSASSGHSLVFFPEGTFISTPGLGRFHTGAFVTAARAGCPVVPVVIRGTRQALPPGSPLLSPRRIEVEILLPLPTSGAQLDSIAASVREEARRAILSRLGEPDLSPPRAAEAAP